MAVCYENKSAPRIHSRKSSELSNLTVGGTYKLQLCSKVLKAEAGTAQAIYKSIYGLKTVGVLETSKGVYEWLKKLGTVVYSLIAEKKRLTTFHFLSDLA
jgi:hypothetical protein